MDETYTLSLALFDFVPVACFLVGAWFLVRLASWTCGARCGNLAIAGSLLIFLGGFLKASWKLLYSTGVGDFAILSESQFALLAPGFLALLIAVIWMARRLRTETVPVTPLLAIAPWKIPPLIIMTLASMGVQGILTYVSFRRGARLAAAGFILAFLCLVGMGAMTSSEQTVSQQWIEQSVNAAGQFGFMIGSILLYRKVTMTTNLTADQHR